ncbi:hypothetical protein NDU88_006287 [Pleurodeles waltl]|uniref:Uncharacterized protein n=1 Tax=Pleurodeles waltl TaxID=8319 RepID=A0AAV7RRK3_PLEWA|nr:hypothetical protein NDU88_006287 [Pleurodeles waltl]
MDRRKSVFDVNRLLFGLSAAFKMPARGLYLLRTNRKNHMGFEDEIEIQIYREAARRSPEYVSFYCSLLYFMEAQDYQRRDCDKLLELCASDLWSGITVSEESEESELSFLESNVDPVEDEWPSHSVIIVLVLPLLCLRPWANDCVG